MRTLMMAIAVWLVTWEAASLIAELPNAAPSDVRRNGKYCAVKFAFDARLLVIALFMDIVFF
jgi:hypothetical protein